MGTQSIVTGRIVISDDIEQARELIKTFEADEYYPCIRTEMFSLGVKGSYYYDEQVITFGATYKAVEYDWKEFILKFEHILRNINFDTAKIQLETEFLGTYDFFWKKKINREKFERKEKLIETEEWYFGFGNRSMFGLLDSDSDEPVFSMEEFTYPISFNDSEVKAYNLLIKNIDHQKIGIKQYPYKWGLNVVKLHHTARAILLIKSFENELDFGFDEHFDKNGSSVFNNKKMYIVLNRELSEINHP
ncbi:MAG: Unknown protein [uncultured Sulfurovum sp.]|uniref:Uncharacterized protein n=1 Tax=uncultured Sulfurovum sp. TaxID=269237 RepID=A0A6S6TJ13_9BACT|nr:MAG: Unknown protein [uncultured Sulfurovum sp.]